MKVQSILFLGALCIFYTSCDSYTSKVPLGSPQESVIDSSIIGFWRAYNAFESEEEFDLEILEKEDEKIDQFISILPFNENYYIVDYMNFEDTTASLIHFLNQTNYWRNLSQELNFYNSSGDITDSISQKWDNENKTWINSTRILNYYDNTGNKTSYSKEKWNNKLKEWVNQNRESTSYNGSNIKERTTQNWNSKENSWINKAQRQYYYDDDNNITEYILQINDTATNEWRNSLRELYNYDNIGNTIEKVIFSWDKTSNDWIRNSRSTYSYDSSGNNNECTSYTWNKEKSNWGKNSIEILVYDDNGNRIEKENQSFNLSTGKLSNKRRTMYKYDKKGNQTDAILQYWKPEIMQWQDSKNNPIHNSTFNDSGQKTESIKGAKTKENYSYDRNGNLLIKIYYKWSTDEKEWIKSNQVNYSYDLLGNLIEATKEGKVYSSYPAYAKFKVFSSSINNTDYYNINFILDIESGLPIAYPNNYSFLMVEKLGEDLLKVLVLGENFELEFNSSLEFRDYIYSNFDEFNENFTPFYILKKLKLDSYLD